MYMYNVIGNRHIWQKNFHHQPHLDENAEILPDKYLELYMVHVQVRCQENVKKKARDKIYTCIMYKCTISSYKCTCT